MIFEKHIPFPHPFLLHDDSVETASHVGLTNSENNDISPKILIPYRWVKRHYLLGFGFHIIYTYIYIYLGNL